jgi:hypothetical protein
MITPRPGRRTGGRPGQRATRHAAQDPAADNRALSGEFPHLIVRRIDAIGRRREGQNPQALADAPGLAFRIVPPRHRRRS